MSQSEQNPMVEVSVTRLAARALGQTVDHLLHLLQCALHGPEQTLALVRQQQPAALAHEQPHAQARFQGLHLPARPPTG